MYKRERSKISQIGIFSTKQKYIVSKDRNEHPQGQGIIRCLLDKGISGGFPLRAQYTPGTFSTKQKYIVSNDRNSREGTKSTPSRCGSFRHTILGAYYGMFLNATPWSSRKRRGLFCRISASPNPGVLRGFLDVTSIPYRKIRSGLEIGSKRNSK